MAVRPSLPYMGLARLATAEQREARVQQELEKLRQAKIEAEKRGMEVRMTFEGYEFVPKKPSFEAIVDAYGNYVPAHTMVPEERPYDTNIDVAAVLSKERPHFWASQIICYTDAATDKEIEEEILALNNIISIEYYSKEENILLEQVIVYLQSKLSKDK